MAVNLLVHEVSDLCLGKPALRSLSISSSVADAISALKRSGENYLSVWSCEHSSTAKVDFDSCRCVGKICMVDVVCYLCREENLSCPSIALSSPISVLLPKDSRFVRHVESSSRLVEVIDLILEGAQNLIVPIKSSISSRKKLLKSSSGPVHNGWEFCWITKEDVVRFLLSSISLFSPIPAFSIESLGIINTDTLVVGYHDPASSAIDAIYNSHIQQTSVAVVDIDGKLIGEISPFTLASCDETVAAAITTLSAGDLMAYIDCGGPPEDLVQMVKARLKEKKLEGILELLEESSLCSWLSSSSSSSSCSSSDEEFPLSPTVTGRSGRYSRSVSYSARMMRRSEAIVCHPRSSLVAVMIQALAHRVTYVWVIEDDCSLVGIVTFCEILKVFREHLQSMQ